MFSTVFNDLIFLMVFLILGVVIRGIIKPLKNLYIPAGLIGGILALILGPQVLHVIDIPETWGGMATPMITIVLTSMIFGIVISKSKVKNYLGAIDIFVLTYFSQLFVGIFLGNLLRKIWPSLPQAWGTMSCFTFWGGHGAATSAGTLYEELGISDMTSIGLILATFGLFISMIVGMTLVNYSIRKGYASHLKTDGVVLQGDDDLIPKEKQKPLGFATVSSSNVNGLVFQFALICLSIWIGNQLFDLIAQVLPIAEKFPDFIHGIIGAIIVWFFMCKTKLDAYADKKTISTISGMALDICIMSATACLNLDVFAKFLVPILIFTAVIVVMMIFICMFLIKRWLKKDWLEIGLMAFGQGTGSTPCGFALARCVDPLTESTAWEAYGVSHGCFTPITSTLVAIIPLIAVQSEWIIIGISGAITLIAILFGELVLRRS
ncbi:MAG: sodium/glutamate symporter [Lachnospiraceae bacterium]